MISRSVSFAFIILFLTPGVYGQVSNVIPDSVNTGSIHSQMDTILNIARDSVNHHVNHLADTINTIKSHLGSINSLPGIPTSLNQFSEIEIIQSIPQIDEIPSNLKIETILPKSGLTQYNSIPSSLPTLTNNLKIDTSRMSIIQDELEEELLERANLGALEEDRGSIQNSFNDFRGSGDQYARYIQYADQKLVKSRIIEKSKGIASDQLSAYRDKISEARQELNSYKKGAVTAKVQEGQ